VAKRRSGSFQLAITLWFCSVSSLALAQVSQATPAQALQDLTLEAMPSPTDTLGAITPVPVAPIPLDTARADMLAKDVVDLADMLEGRWDNEVQTFFEPEIGVPQAGRHDRVHTIIRQMDNPAFGPLALYVEYRRDGENGAIVRQRVWMLSVDPTLGALRLMALAPKDGKPFEAAWRDPAKLSAMTRADFVPVTGCDIIWRRRADGFSGETRPGTCKVVTTSTPPRVLNVNERHDLSASAWDVRDIGVDERGTRVFGSFDGAPTRLRRAASFVCWASALKGNQTATVTDLVLHDQGGVATAVLDGANPNSVTLRLRNIDWPVGQNRPSLTLYLMSGARQDIKGYAWAEPDAKRIALNIGGVQASCTRDERALWR
jgi:hypothetical protein